MYRNYHLLIKFGSAPSTFDELILGGQIEYVEAPKFISDKIKGNVLYCMSLYATCMQCMN